MAAGPFISAPAVPVSLGPVDALPAERVSPTISAGGYDGDSTTGRSIFGCGCSDALSEFATASPSAASIALRFSIAYHPRIGRSPIGNQVRVTNWLPIACERRRAEPSLRPQHARVRRPPLG